MHPDLSRSTPPASNSCLLWVGHFETSALFLRGEAQLPEEAACLCLTAPMGGQLFG